MNYILVSDVVAEEFKEERMRLPSYQELGDLVVEGVVESYRTMLSEYDLLEEERKNAQEQEKQNPLSETSKRMELLKLMLRIITDAFEAIFQRIQYIQYTMNEELSGN